MKKEKEEILEFLARKGYSYIPEIRDKFDFPDLSSILDELKKEGKIDIFNNGKIVPTSVGLREGRNIAEKHDILEKFLKELGIDKKKADEEACELEHFLPDEGKERLRGVFGFGEGSIVTLLSLSAGDEGEVVSIRGGRGMVQRLLDMGLTPGTRIKVIRRAPFGPIEISVRGYHLALGRGIAGRIWVRRRR